MIAALMTAAALQMDPSAFATACMSGGGAPGRVEATSGREVGVNYRISNGATPVTVMITVNRISPATSVSVWIDGNAALRIEAGSAAIATGRRIEFGFNERDSFDYCLRLQQR